MSLPKINPTSTKSWSALTEYYKEFKASKMQEMFARNSNRADQMCIDWNGFYFDYSKNRIDKNGLNLLMNLAEEVRLKDAIQAQFKGELINETEGRAVLHTALRDFSSMRTDVRGTLDKMKLFTNEVTSGNWKGHTGKSITDVVNIGIGGSDLGPDMVVEALRYYRNHLNVHFVSNVDGDHVMESIRNLDPETTLFIIVSKSFTTQETLTNANTIRQWFLQNASESDIARHFVAVSTNLVAVSKFGIDVDNIFPMWDWVGGRFSLWSAVGLSISCAVGYNNFEKLLKGAHAADVHFKEADFKENIPVMMAMLSVWYNNFFGAESECIVPYSQYLNKLVAYLQQGIMESNGKGVDRNGEYINYQTGTIIWGSTGTNAQHAFFQLIHQGTKLIPADFICYKESLYKNKDHQDKLLANCIAQTEALMQGTVGSEVENNFKEFSGNRPTNTILIDKLTPESLGSLIAFYEHKLFVQGVIWNIFSYDQWGVELGKKLAKGTLEAIQSGDFTGMNNSSTRKLIQKVRK